MPVPPARLLGWAATLVFASGLCAVTYQVAWLRLLRLVFGASTTANATVLAMFMGGLGLGGLLLGRVADRSRRPLELFGRLEIAIGLAAGLTPWLIVAVRAVYLGLGGTARLGDLGGNLLRLALSALVLGVPTVLMGGTLPAIARAVEGAADQGRRALGILYGVNTLGAVSGALWATFFGIELLGTRKVVWIAALVNVLVGLLARSIARDSAPRDQPASEAVATAVPGASPPLRHALVAAMTVGFVFFLMELVWYRMLAPLLGGSSYSFGLILAIALLGIGAGGLIYGAGEHRVRPTLELFAVTCALEALALGIPFALGDRLALLAMVLRGLGAGGFTGVVLGWAVVTAIVVLPAAIVAGYQFPALVGIIGAADREVGRQVGLVYAWNTLGAIAGAIAGGFLLLPALGATGSWRLSIALLAITAGAFLWIARRRAPLERARTRSVIATATAILALLLLSVPRGPSAPWRHGGVGVGRRAPTFDSPNELRADFDALRADIVWERDGRESSVALLTSTSGYAFLVNGKSDGSSRGDAPTQVTSGLIGSLLHTDPRTALVIGLGTGSSSGWLAAVPGMERVDTVELEPVVERVAQACAPVNQDVLANPRSRVVYGDGREWLLSTREQYDVIFSEPSNPYRAGVSSLFSVEFYRAASARLGEHGIFLQWLQGYEIDAELVSTAIATLASVFPEIHVWQVASADLVLAATTGRIDFDLDRLRERVEQEPYRSALELVWGVNGVEGFLSGYVAGPELARALLDQADGDLNTDDRPLIEFGFVRNLGRRGLFDPRQLPALARSRGWHRVAGLQIDWEEVEDARAARDLMFGHTPAGGGDLESVARNAARQAYNEARWRQGVEQWAGQPRDPYHHADLGYHALALAMLGHDEAPAMIERLRGVQPLEADAVEGMWLARRDQPEAAARLLARAFVGYRADPWPIPRILIQALRTTREIVRDDPASGRRLFHAIEEPFVLELLHDERRSTLIALAFLVDPEGLCAQAFAQFEPYPSWNETFLTQRAECYQRTGSPLLGRALRELGDFRESAPPSLSASLSVESGSE